MFKLILFMLGLMINTTELYIRILEWVRLTVIQGHIGVKKQKLLRYLTNFSSVWMEFDMLYRLFYPY